jgi:hypothetical protein
MLAQVRLGLESCPSPFTLSAPGIAGWTTVVRCTLYLDHPSKIRSGSYLYSGGHLIAAELAAAADYL